MIHGNVAADKASIKKDAWLCKGFCVLVKRNYSRGRLCSSYEHFAMLMRVLAGGDDEDDDAQDNDGFRSLYRSI